MRRALAFIAVLATLAGPAAGGEKRMLGEEEARAWRGVGRLNIAGRRFCTATLIAPTQALTAAHCLYNPRTKRATPLRELRFVAGLRLGGYAAVRRVARAATLPGYRYDGEASLAAIGSDLALIELDRPVTAEEAAAFELAPGAAWSAEATVVSYARDRAHAPSIHEPCTLTGSWGAVAALACDVTYGASGAPVFAPGEGRPRLLGVVSAMAEGGEVALAVRAEAALPALVAALKAAPAPTP